jgi:hypothetical protein
VSGPWRTKQQNTEIAVYERNDDDSQQWHLEDVGAGRVVIANRRPGQVTESIGEERSPLRNGGVIWNRYRVEQLNRRDNQRDQKWRFVNH